MASLKSLKLVPLPKTSQSLIVGFGLLLDLKSRNCCCRTQATNGSSGHGRKMKLVRKRSSNLPDRTDGPSDCPETTKLL